MTEKMQMKQKRRQAIMFLFTGHYFRATRNLDGVQVYKIFKDNEVSVTYFPVEWLHPISPPPELFNTPAPAKEDGESFARFFKKDRKGRITLNLSIVRQQHGNTWIKKRYKQFKHEKNDHQSGAPEACTEETGAGRTGKACHPCLFEPALPGVR